jgi:hypothetical protein
MEGNEQEERKYVVPDGRLPEWCPFCYATDAVKWDEFRVNFIVMRYFSEGEDRGACGDHLQVFCTRCDEEIREEDARDAEGVYAPE